MRRTIGRLAQLLVLTLGALALGRAGLALGTAWAAERHVFLPLPAAAKRAARAQQGIDSARVARLLQAARGTNTVACELAAATVDGRSGWSSGTDGDFTAGSSADSTARDVATWLHHGDVHAGAVPILRAALADPDWCVRRLAAPLLGRVHDPSAMQAMLAALAATDPVAREMAALALGFADDPRLGRATGEPTSGRRTASAGHGRVGVRRDRAPRGGAPADRRAGGSGRARPRECRPRAR